MIIIFRSTYVEFQTIQSSPDTPIYTYDLYAVVIYLYEEFHRQFDGFILFQKSIVQLHNLIHFYIVDGFLRIFFWISLKCPFKKMYIFYLRMF